MAKKKKKKYKGTIVTCGYYSLNSAIVELAKMGWRIVKLHRMPNDQIKDIVVDHGDELHKHVSNRMRTGASELDRRVSIANSRVEARTITDDEEMLLATFGIGGRQFMNTPTLVGLTATKLGSAVITINGTYSYFVELMKKYKDIKAVLVHTGEGATYRTLIEAAKIHGIPAFTCLNGCISGTSSRYSAHTLYDSPCTYYLHGQYDVDYIVERQIEVDVNSYPVVGQPSFDMYYKSGKVKQYEREPNTFLYCVIVVCSVLYLPIVDVEATIQMVDFAMFRKVLPVNTDGMFFEGFAKYQKEHNPDAKLKVAMRPYYNLLVDDMKNYIEHFGTQNVEVFAHEDKPTRELMGTTEYLVSGESTVLVEGMLNRMPVLYLTGYGGVGNKFTGTDEWTVHAKTDSVDDVVNGLIKMSEEKERLIDSCDKWANHYNYKDDGRAGKRLAKDLDGRIG